MYLNLIGNCNPNKVSLIPGLLGQEQPARCCWLGSARRSLFLLSIAGCPWPQPGSTDHMANPSALQTLVRETPGPFLSSNSSKCHPSIYSHFLLTHCSLRIGGGQFDPIGPTHVSCGLMFLWGNFPHLHPQGPWEVLPSQDSSFKLAFPHTQPLDTESPVPSCGRSSTSQPSSAQPSSTIVSVQVAGLLKEGLDHCVWRELTHGPAF